MTVRLNLRLVRAGLCCYVIMELVTLLPARVIVSCLFVFQRAAAALKTSKTRTKLSHSLFSL